MKFAEIKDHILSVTRAEDIDIDKVRDGIKEEYKKLFEYTDHLEEELASLDERITQDNLGVITEEIARIGDAYDGNFSFFVLEETRVQGDDFFLTVAKNFKPDAGIAFKYKIYAAQIEQKLHKELKVELSPTCYKAHGTEYVAGYFETGKFTIKKDLNKAAELYYDLFLFGDEDGIDANLKFYKRHLVDLKEAREDLINRMKTNIIQSYNYDNHKFNSDFSSELELISRLSSLSLSTVKIVPLYKNLSEFVMYERSHQGDERNDKLFEKVKNIIDLSKVLWDDLETKDLLILKCFADQSKNIEISNESSRYIRPKYIGNGITLNLEHTISEWSDILICSINERLVPNLISLSANKLANKVLNVNHLEERIKTLEAENISLKRKLEDLQSEDKKEESTTKWQQKSLGEKWICRIS